MQRGIFNKNYEKEHEIFKEIELHIEWIKSRKGKHKGHVFNVINYWLNEIKTLTELKQDTNELL